MNFAKAVILGLALASTSVAFAKTPRQLRGLGAMIEQQRIARPAARSIAPQCADLSGQWVGTCVEIDDPNSSEEQSLVIYQDGCQSISVGGLFSDIFGSTTFTTSPAPDNDFGGFSMVQSYSWNDSQTRLRGLTTISAFSGAWAVITGQAIWLQGDQLRVKDEFATPVMEATGPTEWHLVRYDCTYNRAR